MSVRIIADSACDLPSSAHPALTVLPLTVAFGSDIYRDGVDITTDRFYEMLVEGDALPTTSQVTPYEFGEAFRDAVEAGEEVVVVTVSGDLSGTYASALAAAEGMDAVHVVDSRNVTVGEHILVRYALSLVDEGLDAAQIAARLAERRDDIRVVALLDTLEYLRRGGRVPAAVGVIGEMLAIKPVVAVRAGLVEVIGRARGSKNGRNLLKKEIDECGAVDFRMPFCLGYSGLSDSLLRKYVEDQRELWEGKIDPERIPVCRVGSTIGTHVGPGAIAVAFFARPAHQG